MSFSRNVTTRPRRTKHNEFIYIPSSYQTPVDIKDLSNFILISVPEKLSVKRLNKHIPEIFVIEEKKLAIKRRNFKDFLLRTQNEYFRTFRNDKFKYLQSISVNGKITLTFKRSNRNIKICSINNELSKDQSIAVSSKKFSTLGYMKQYIRKLLNTWYLYHDSKIDKTICLADFLYIDNFKDEDCLIRINTYGIVNKKNQIENFKKCIGDMFSKPKSPLQLTFNHLAMLTPKRLKIAASDCENKTLTDFMEMYLKVKISRLENKLNIQGNNLNNFDNLTANKLATPTPSESTELFYINNIPHNYISNQQHINNYDSLSSPYQANFLYTNNPNYDFPIFADNYYYNYFPFSQDYPNVENESNIYRHNKFVFFNPRNSNPTPSLTAEYNTRKRSHSNQ